MNVDQHQALSDVLEVGFGRRRPDPEQPATTPLTYVDAALVVDAAGHPHICAVLVKDFYREEPQR